MRLAGPPHPAVVETRTMGVSGDRSARCDGVASATGVQASTSRPCRVTGAALMHANVKLPMYHYSTLAWCCATITRAVARVTSPLCQSLEVASTKPFIRVRA